MHQRSTLNPSPARSTETMGRRMPAKSVLSDAVEAGVLVHMDLAMLVRHCLIESERFYRGQAHDTRFSYELFRRAIVERNESAWEYVYSHYSNLVESWVRRSGAFASSGESSEFFVVLAFTKFWRAITPERFTTFSTLAALLQYLQLCAGCVVIDSVRAQSWAEMLPEEAIPCGRAPQLVPDEEALDRVSRQEFWGYISTQLNDDAERVVVFGSYVMGMKPGDIYDQHRSLFSGVNDVYNVKRNVLGRLSRNQDLRRMINS